ncbi:MAG TPA: non-heme iron oxygenase ferredoxin subunit [Burkholderiaceae bacterium]|nr:non-heme iron oxygenase ferredoxin subunit [Burkholderiaceae bacterium]
MPDFSELPFVWHDACAEAEVHADEPRSVKIADIPVGLYRLGEAIHALSDVCTHEFALLSGGFVEGGKIECPLHQACFDIRSGKCFGPMAEHDLKTFPVRIVRGRVMVGLCVDR